MTTTEKILNNFSVLEGLNDTHDKNCQYDVYSYVFFDNDGEKMFGFSAVDLGDAKKIASKRCANSERKPAYVVEVRGYYTIEEVTKFREKVPVRVPQSIGCELHEF